MSFFNGLWNILGGGGAQGAAAPQNRQQSFRGNNEFSQTLAAFSISSADNKNHLEEGNRVILPQSILAQLTYLNIDSYPILFRVVNPASQKLTHVGVMEFDAPEGIGYFPVWIMKMLAINDGDIVFLKKVVLEKGRLVKFQPHFTSFVDLSNPKAVLERALKNFSCLTLGDTIIIPFGDMVYPIDITAVEPSKGKAISIIDTDLNVDFDEPKDFKEYMAHKQLEAKILEEQKSAPSEIVDLTGDEIVSNGIPIQNSPFFSASDELAPGKSSPAKSNYFAKLGPGHKLKDKSENNSQQSAESEEKQSRYTLPQASSQTETVVKGQWKYIYSVDPKTQTKKLLKRVPK